MISPLFPPSGIIGAKRALNFARHLPALGWQPAVVALPAGLDRDAALDRFVPEVPIWRGFRGGPVAWIEDRLGRKRPGQPYRAPSGSGAEGALDRYAQYLPWAFAGAWRLLRRERCAAIYVNAGPHSAQILGWALSMVTGVPLVLDLRDPWSIEPNYRAARSTAANRRVDTMERCFFRRAARIVLNTESARSAYQAYYEGVIPSERFTTIRNAFDPELYDPPPATPATSGPFQVIYYGHLRPAKNAILFLEGYRRFVDAERLQAGEAMLTTFGSRTAADEEAITRLGLGPWTRTHPWVSFPQSRGVLAEADVLLDLMGSEHGLQISGKFFDYLAAGRPILSVTPSLELERILNETGAGERVDLDAGAIAAALGRALTRKRTGVPFAPDLPALRQYEARPAAERLAGLLEEVTR
jgi:glycosyltransferase involved in cell wall biosynthesis